MPNQLPPPTPWTPKEDGGLIEDLALAVPRGVAGAAQGVYGLADTLTGDALPDWKDNPFGKSSTFVGGLAEGAVQFATGFIPVVGVGRWAGLLGKAGWLAEEGAGLANTARTLAAGAIADFAVWQGHQDRLSNLIEAYPSLSNPITEFLANDPNDPELLGRLKGAIEGVGLGAMTDAVFAGVKKMGVFSRARANALEALGPDAPQAAVDAATKDAAKVAEQAVPEAEIKSAYEKAASQSDPFSATASDIPLDSESATDALVAIGHKYGLGTGIPDTAHEASPITIVDNTMVHPDGEGGATLGKSKAKVEPWDVQVSFPEAGDTGAIPKHIYTAQRIRATGEVTLNKALLDKLGDKAGDFIKEIEPVLKQTHDPDLPIKATAEPVATKTAKTELGSVVESQSANLKTIGLSEQDIKDTINTIDSVILRHSAESTSVGINPRNLSGPQLLNLALSEKGFNLEHYGVDDRAKSLIRAYEELFQAADKGWKAEAVTEQSFAQQAAEGIASLADITGARSTDAMHTAIAGTSDAFGLSVRGLSARVYAMRTLMSSLAVSNVEQLDRLAQIADGSIKGDHNLEMAVAIKNMQTFTDVSSTLRGAKAEIGRALGGMRQDVRAVVLDKNVAKTAADKAAEAIPFNEWRQVNPRDLADRPEEIKRLLDKSGGAANVKSVLDKMRAVYGAGGEEGLASFGKAANGLMKPLGRRIYDGFMEFWINALVSGPKTAIVNAGGPLAYSYFKPLEAMTGAAILGTATTNASRRAAQMNVARELYAQTASMMSGLGEAVQTAKRMGFNAPDVFDTRSGTSVMDNIARRKAISSANFPELNQEGLTASMINWFGNVARIPSGVLGTTDNILKTLNYRAAARGRIEADLIAKGVPDEQIASKVAETMDRLIWDHQVYSQNQLMRRGLSEADKAGITDSAQRALYALDYANRQINLHPEDQALSDFAKAQGYDATLTTPAAPGSVSANWQNFVAQHPALRLVTPFINTPLNIMKATGQRFDALSVARYFAGQLTDPQYFGLQKAKSRFIQEMMSNDPRLQAEAVGRITTGMAVATTAYTLVSAGYITGGGPSDPAHRKTLLDAGWQPYSFRTDKGYVSYSRLDPLASMIGTMADIYEYSQYAPHGSDTAIGELTLAAATALANNMTNKTYLTGVANFVDMARQPDKKMGSFFRSYASSLVPNIFGQATGAVGGDETQRDVNSMLDAVKNKIPGLSSTLPPQRNALGEPMTRTMSLGGRVTDWWLPVGYREVSDDIVKREMAKTGHAFSPPSSTYEGLDLNGVKVGNTTAYDRWGELQGTVRLSGMTLKDAMRKVIASPAYQRSIPVDVGETESPRVNMLNSMIYRFRDAAWRKLLTESPELAAHARNVVLNKLAARRGDLFAIGQNQ